jgi:hypothetical protein
MLKALGWPKFPFSWPVENEVNRGISFGGLVTLDCKSEKVCRVWKAFPHIFAIYVVYSVSGPDLPDLTL